ncbi:MAG: iron ABC transporter permease [Eubacteriales bacterium]|nr:iron ABC transporter permease [Eubacteriales bacterium]
MKIAADIFWTFGDLGRISWSENLIMAIIVAGALVYFMFMRWNYNAIANGEELAKSLGVKTSQVRFWGLLLSSLLTAVSVAFMGMIGFIGLIGPHIMKRLIGTDHRFLIPASALMGSVILLLADTVARTVISPIILPVGAVTSLLGAPLFFYMLLKGKRVR